LYETEIKNDTEVARIISTAFSAITFYYLYGSEATKSTSIATQDVRSDGEDSDEEELASHTPSVCIAVQTPLAGAHTQLLPKRNTSNPADNSRKKAKTNPSRNS
jgi:hypothetical protein